MSSTTTEAKASPYPSEQQGGEFLFVEDVAAMLGVHKRTIHERTRHNQIPHRIAPHSRRCLFVRREVEAWLQGAELESVELPGNGRIVRPVAGNWDIRRGEHPVEHRAERIVP